MTKLERLLSHANITESCWFWNGARDKNGYGRVSSVSYGESLAHRAVYVCSGNNIPPDLYLLHVCDNPSCVNPAHMRAGSQKENLMHAKAIGRKLGMKPRKVTDDILLEIHQLLDAGVPQRTIAAKYGVVESYITNIKQRKRQTNHG